MMIVVISDGKIVQGQEERFEKLAKIVGNQLKLIHDGLMTEHEAYAKSFMNKEEPDWFEKGKETIMSCCIYNGNLIMDE